MISSDEFAARRTRFLDAFYGEGNELTRQALATSQTRLASVARDWEGLLRDEGSVALLPRKRGKQWTWYAIAFDARSLRDLGEQLMAFVGPSYSTFRGAHRTLDVCDPIEAALLEFSGPYAFRLSPLEGNEARAEFVEALGLLRRTHLATSGRPVQRIRSTGRLVRDFQMALAAVDRAQAVSCLQALGAQNRLDALNLRFLEIQAHAELGDWTEIIESAHFHDLTQVRRPIAVTRAMVQAVYRVRLARFEADDRPEEAARIFRNEIIPEYAPLYRVRSGLVDADSVKSFMLLAVSATPLSPALRDELLAVRGLAQTDAAYIERLAALLPDSVDRSKTPEPSQIEAARTAMLAADFDRAVGLAVSAPATIERAAILLRSAYELSSTVAGVHAVAAVRALNDGERADLFGSRAHRGFWESVTGTSVLNASSAGIPCDWIGFLAQIHDPSWSDARARDMAAAAPDQWDIAAMASDPASVQLLVDGIDRVVDSTSGLAIERFGEALPHLLRNLEQDPAYPRPEFRPVYDSLRRALVYACGRPTVSYLILFDDLCVAELELGCTEKAYRDMVEEAELVWREISAPASLRPMVDLLDQLYYYPCPAADARTRLASLVFGQAAPWLSSGRIEGELLSVLRQLSRDFASEGMLPCAPQALAEAGDGEPDDPLSSLSGLVAIHTLTYPAGLRAKEILKARSPHCEVVVNSDKVGTNQLRDLARTADVFVLVTGSAKHAASGYVSTHRPSDRPLLRPAGKGTTSILQALADHTRSVH